MEVTVGGWIRQRVRIAAAFALALGIVAAIVVVPSQSADATTGGSASIAGTVTEKGSGTPLSRIEVLLYSSSWTYLSTQSTGASGWYYFGGLARGVYHLKYVDKRAVWDVSSHAYKEAKVSVTRSSAHVTKNVRLAIGASITGTVRTVAGAAKKATVIAVNQYGGVYQTTANNKGQFAIGGLTAAKYSIFYYDKKNKYTGKSSWVGKLALGKNTNVTKTLSTRAGSLAITLTGSNGARLTSTTYATLVNKKTGQWWVVKVAHGTAIARGLAPGRYTLSVSAAGRYLAASFTRTVRVTSAHRGTYVARLTAMGGTVSGTVVDAVTPSTRVAGVTVTLYSQTGTWLASTKTSQTGTFTVGGAIADQKVTVVLSTYWSIKGITYARAEYPNIALKKNTNILLAGGTISLPHK